MRSGSRCAIALPKVAFDFEIELLRKIAGQIDARPTQTKTIIYRGLTKTAFERGDHRRLQS